MDGRDNFNQSLKSDMGSRSFTLMRKDVEAAVFRWNPRTNDVRKPCRAVSVKDLPFGCLNNVGQFNSKSLMAWLKDRSIPALRPDVMRRLNDIGIANPTELLSMSLGLSLSDQYWIRPDGFNLTWSEVNHFNNEFSELLGELLLPHDPDSLPEIERIASSSHELLGQSPDPALNGNLPKSWVNIDGELMLRKAGRAENRYQEPFNEYIATDLCRRLLDESEFVPYELEVEGFLKYFSLCPCMVDESTEFVPAIQLYRSHQKLNHEDVYTFYSRILGDEGLDAAMSLEKMIAIDYILANYDRHWNNFGVLVDSDSREFLQCAPIFDSGESLWCDREMRQRFDGYTFYKQEQIRPFSRNLDEQLLRFCTDLSWFDSRSLDGFTDLVVETLSLNALISADYGRMDKIAKSIEKRVDDVEKLALELNPVFAGGDFPDTAEALFETKCVETAARDSKRNPSSSSPVQHL